MSKPKAPEMGLFLHYICLNLGIIVFRILQIIQPFYQKFDFYLFLIIGGAGLYYSIQSYRQAKAAKKAAEGAGKIVKIQDILLDIPEIINLCQQVDIKVDYSSAILQMTSVMGKISKVIGVFSGDPNINNQQPIIKEIEESLIKIQEVLKNLNPVYLNEAEPKQKTDVVGYVYYSIAPYTTTLIGQLNLLSGSLHGQMIQNK